MDFTTIIWAVVVLGALAIVFGLILAVAAKVFEVEVDPRLPEIQACLAGANCGGWAIPAAPAAPRPFWPARLPSPPALRRRRGRCQNRCHHGHGGSLRREDGGSRALQRRHQRREELRVPGRAGLSGRHQGLRRRRSGLQSTAVWASAPAWPPASLMRSTSVPTALPWWIRRSVPTAAPAVRPVPGSSLWRSPIPRRYSSTAPTRIKGSRRHQGLRQLLHRLRYVPAHL